MHELQLLQPEYQLKQYIMGLIEVPHKYEHSVTKWSVNINNSMAVSRCTLSYPSSVMAVFYNSRRLEDSSQEKPTHCPTLHMISSFS
jgi:hypothetical protein